MSNIGRFFCNSEVLNMHHGMEERLVVEVGAVANAGLVGIDGVDGVVEHFADLLVVRDTQPDERKDTKFGKICRKDWSNCL